MIISISNSAVPVEHEMAYFNAQIAVQYKMRTYLLRFLINAALIFLELTN
jgi:hypothetical protein